MISIIVPVYNAEKYLRETIDSILNQDYCEFELILVDDGSMDESLKICNEYAQKNPKVRVFTQKNSGVSAARNKGLKEANGEYVAFADADDLLECDMLRTLITCAELHDADVVSCGAKVVENGKVVSEEFGTNTLTVYDSTEAIKFFLIGKHVNIGVWTKLFKKTLLDKIYFSEDRKMNEDKLFIFEALMKVDKFVVHDIAKYIYCKREGSATMRSFDDRWFDALDIADFMLKKIETEKPELLRYANINQIKSYYWILLKMYRSKGAIETYKDEYNRIVRVLKKKNIFTLIKYLPRNMFAQILLLQISEPMLRKIKQKKRG